MRWIMRGSSVGVCHGAPRPSGPPMRSGSAPVRERTAVRAAHAACTSSCERRTPARGTDAGARPVPPRPGTQASAAGVSSLSAALSCSRSSGVSWWPCAVTACVTAAWRMCSSLPDIARSQLLSLGISRQSMYFLLTGPLSSSGFPNLDGTPAPRNGSIPVAENLGFRRPEPRRARRGRPAARRRAARPWARATPRSRGGSPRRPRASSRARRRRAPSPRARRAAP
jgi:hypothetical protein